MFWIIIVLGVLLAIVLAIGVGIRNEYVYHIRGKILTMNSEWVLNHLLDIESKEFYTWFRSFPSYDRMVLEFWKTKGKYLKEHKSLDEFYFGGK